MSFKFGLVAKNKGANLLGKSANNKAPGREEKTKKTKQKSLLGDDDDDEDTSGSAISKANSKTKDDGISEIGDLILTDVHASPSETPKAATGSVKGKKRQPPAPPSTKVKSQQDDPTQVGYSASALEAEKRAQEAVAIDSSIYDYDAAYDALHAKSAAKAAAERDDAAQRRPKYMDALFESAEQRKKDQLRARDKLLQREREAEGDEFADKDKFVTGAYKTQQEEARKAEEEDKKRQEAEDEKKKKFGMQAFHKHMLMEQERRHQEAIEATAQALNEGVKPIDESDKQMTDAERVAQLRKEGKTVIVNEDGQVADQRQLLNAGLNIIAKPRTTTPASASAQHPDKRPAYALPKTSRAAQRDRQTQMVLEQIELANKRKADDEAEQQAQLLHASKTQKTASEISSARERYLQRKKEAAAAKAAARAT